MKSVETPKFDNSQIPEPDVKNLCATIVTSALRFIQDPMNAETVKDWEHRFSEKPKNKNGGKYA